MATTGKEALSCDVLVIGGGMAGCWAALRARDYVDKVILVDKGKVSRSGMSPMCGGYILCPTADDDLAAWHQELVERGEYMSDQDWVQQLLEKLPARIKEMDSWGPIVEKNEQGNYNRFKGRGHISSRIVIFNAMLMFDTFRKKLTEKGIQVLDRTMVVDLLTSDGQHPTRGQVTGVIGLNTRTSEPVVIKAGAVILTTGGSGFGDELTALGGDGIGLAYRAGAEITGMEFTRWWANWSFAQNYRAGHLNQWQGINWHLLNKDGERFMLKYFPELGERGREQDLSSGFGKEYVEGRGPIYADLRHASAEELQWTRKTKAMEHIMTALDGAGIPIDKELIRFDLSPGFMFFQGGGIRNNVWTETNIAGLYAAGQVGGYPTHGTYSVGGVNIGTSTVSGYQAGEFAGKFAREVDRKAVVEEQAESLAQKCLAPLSVKVGPKPQDINDMRGRYMSHPNRAFFRHDKRLREFLAELENWKGMAAECRAEDPHELVKAHGLRNYLTCWELAFVSSLERKETRGACLREDYPYTDNQNWLKRIVISSKPDGMDISFVPIPIYRYPAQPENKGRVPFPFPIPQIEANL